MKSFTFDPKELRGIGIQIQKLEKALTSAQDGSRELAQSKLVFKTMKESVCSSQESSQPLKKPTTPEVDISIVPPSSSPKNNDNDDDEEIIEIAAPPSPKHTQPPKKGEASTLALPSFSQVDNTVFSALPTQMREEIKGEYSRRSASPARTALGEHMDARSLSPPRRGNGGGGGVRTNKGTPLSRITQALAPRTRTGDARSSASAAAARSAAAQADPEGGGGGGNIFERCERQKERRGTKVEVTRVELRRLGIDIEVFLELPVELQLEQLASARFGRSFGGGGGGKRKR